MFHRSHWGCLCILAVFALIPFTGAMPARAAASIGVIDQDVIQTEYQGYKSIDARIQPFIKLRDSVFQSLQMGVGLSLADFKEYERLTKFEVVIDAERVKQYQEVAQENVAKYQGLRQQGEEKLSADDKAQFTKLDAAIKEELSIVEERRNKLLQEIRDEGNRMMQKLSELETKAIEKVAQQKKLDIVLNRNLQTEKEVQRLVLWGGVNITDDVVKLLNAEFKEAMLDAPPAPPAPPAKAPADPK